MRVMIRAWAGADLVPPRALPWALAAQFFVLAWANVASNLIMASGRYQVIGVTGLLALEPGSSVGAAGGDTLVVPVTAHLALDGLFVVPQRRGDISLVPALAVELKRLLGMC